MQSKDLRIGNLVKGNSRGGTHILDIGILKYIDETKSGYSPILLTEKWLINFGFELKEDEGDVKYYEKNTIGIKMDDCLDFYCYIKSYNSNAFFMIKQLELVHELQNLYLALTGEEFEFE